MMENDTPSNWVTLIEYATKTGVSVSTLRRRIKNNRIIHRLDEGKYLIWDENGVVKSDHEQRRSLETRMQDTEMQLQQAREEIAELKTLIAFYEENHQQQPLDQ